MVEHIVKFISDNWELITTIVLACGGFEALMGFLPDKWVPYVGIIRRLVVAAAKKGGVIPVIFLVIVLFISGCGVFSLKSPEQKQVLDLAVSLGSKALGLKLAQSGFVWTSEIQTFYEVIKTQKKLSLDAATQAENYIRRNLDPILQDDALKLARLIGIEFDPLGNVIDTGKVDIELLTIVADGLRLAVLSKQNSASNLNIENFIMPCWSSYSSGY